MAMQAKTFSTAKELADYINGYLIPPGQILAVANNRSGYIELVYDDAQFAYVASTGPTTLVIPEGAAVHQVSVSAVGGAATFDLNGDTIALASGDSFDHDFKGKLVGASDFVFSANAQYFVSWYL